MNFDINNFISSLEARLTEPLPGLQVQLQMAPSFRPTLETNDYYTKAGVLILLYEGINGLSVVFMKRPEYDGVHSNQISFPGGKQEPIDISIVDTALREAFEEVGIETEKVKVLGQLTPLLIPVSKMEVFPVIGYNPNQSDFKPDPYEVEYIIEMNLSGLLSSSIKSLKPYTSKQYTGEIPYFNVNGNHIWGATAMILNEFLEVIRPLY